jgi:hypothetical protein
VNFALTVAEIGSTAMDSEFPPLPSPVSDVARLADMFPSVERAVVEMVLEGVQGELAAATDLLLGMAAPAPPPPAPLSCFASAAALLPARAPPSPAPVPAEPPRGPEPAAAAAQRDLASGFRVMVVMRGLPGSGKSSLARR